MEASDITPSDDGMGERVRRLFQESSDALAGMRSAIWNMAMARATKRSAAHAVFYADRLSESVFRLKSIIEELLSKEGET